ncbi:MAG: DNA-directed RNA polymerase subunit alpha [Patescibacteria group bacterium]
MDNQTNTIILPSSTRVVLEEEFKGVYTIDGLYPGYGNTLGNSIRRILLSSLPGSAITKVKIEGVSHEFSTMENVMEDIITILLNLKQLRFRLHGNEPQICTIDVRGSKEIKGKDAKCPSQLEIVNKDHHIATLTSKNAKFIAELTIERGLGFVPSENLTRDKVPVGTILLDAIFSPIRRVNYEVENMRVGDRTDYNRLLLTVETDGSLSPREALKRSLTIMRDHIDRISTFEDERELSVDSGAKEMPSALSTLHVSPRIQNLLIEAGIRTPEDISSKTEGELLSIEGIGEKALTDIKKALHKAGLTLQEQ